MKDAKGSATINYFKWGVEIAGMDLQATRIWRKQFARMGIPFVCNSHPRPVFDYEHIWSFRKKNGSNKEVVVDRKITQRGVIGESWTSAAGLKTHCAAKNGLSCCYIELGIELFH